MSSILKALKKLENETTLHDGVAGPHAFDARQTLRRQMKPAMRNRPFVALLFVLIFFAGGALFFKGDGPEKTPSTASVAPAVQKMQASPKSVRLSVAKPETSVPPATGLPAGKSEDSSLHEKETIIPVTTEPINALNRKEPQASLLPSGGGQASYTRAPVPEKKWTPPQEETASPPEADSTELMPPPAEAELKLQALAWASEPASRFVVINSQIAREGEGIGGMSVERIEPERVILRKGGELYQLKY